MLSAATDYQRYAPLPRRVDPELWTLDRILLATRGRVLTVSKARQELRSKPLNGLAKLNTIRFKEISTDSRTLSPGDLFITLQRSGF